MAWAERMSSGRWRGCWRDTARQRQSIVQEDGTGFDRKSDAKAAADEEQVKARRQAAVTKGTLQASITWGQWWDLLATKRTFPDTDTADTERNIVDNHLRQRWETVSLNRIEHGEVQDWVDTALATRKGMSPAYAHRIFSLFSLTIKIAMKGKNPILTASPCAGVELPKRPGKRPKPYLAVGTAAAMAEHLREDYRDVIDFGLETGLRPGELAGLHADRLDLDRGWMLVSEVLVVRRRVIRPHPKDDDVRMVPLTDKAIEIARRRLAGRDAGAGCGIDHSDGSRCASTLVFRTVRDRPLNTESLRRCMHRAAKKAGVERRSPYAIRRGWATRAAEGGLDAFQIAEILGHATLDQAQEYVQQTDAARMKLSAALEKYPQLVVIEGGGVGQEDDRGAPRGARPGNKPLRSATNPTDQDTG